MGLPNWRRSWDVGQHFGQGARRLAEGHDGVAATLQVEGLHQLTKGIYTLN